MAGAFETTGIAASINQVATLVGVFFGADAHDYETARRADHARYARFFHGLLDRGVYFAPSGYETLFCGLAHDDTVIDETVAAVFAVADTLE